MRHILSLSGGKDSTALAIYMRDRVPEMEYVFMDTGEELPETYAYLDKLEVYLQRPVVRLKNERAAFADLLAARRGFLPSAQARWCTEYLKLKPFEEYIGASNVRSYLAIRYDERERKGYVSSKANIVPIYPFIDNYVDLPCVKRILEDSGIGMPGYSEWRSRSGCYFCFFQQRIEWVGLLERHPELFWKAAAFEKHDEGTDERYTWSGRESLVELAEPGRVRQIKEDWKRRNQNAAGRHHDGRLLSLFEADENRGCLICHL